MTENPPCELESTNECTPKSALECLRLVKEVEDEVPKVIGRPQHKFEESIYENRERIKTCLIERFLSGQFGAPKGPLRR